MAQLTAKALPADWWQDIGVSFRLREFLKRHVVGLHVAYSLNSEPRHEVFTGVLFQHRGYPFWLTAAHVICTIREMQADSRVRVDHAAFMDHAPESMGGPFSVDLDHLLACPIDPKGLDFGFILLRPGYSELLARNPNLEFLDQRIWQHLDKARPEGFVLLGYPGEWMEADHWNLDRQTRGRRLRTGIACLPLEVVPDRGKAANEGIDQFWGHPACFYGHLLPHNGIEEPLVDSICGMSGGPILSLERDGDGIRYRLFGLQSEWKRESRFIRAGKVSLMSRVIETVIDEVERQGDEGEVPDLDGGRAGV